MSYKEQVEELTDLLYDAHNKANEIQMDLSDGEVDAKRLVGILDDVIRYLESVTHKLESAAEDLEEEEDED